ncbi:SDR family NAD(P)-dependent oxidoreductase [Streptomyces sp. AJS327]|nr:type I polyketide synthase [Streptomyces sp. AJS327]MBA0052624.1 SDR family NAD(P)-dependent oxidoreductase [Streptomyces sp. AJS327]
MSNETSNEQKLLAYLKRVTADLDEANRRLRESEDRGHEPVAVVGLGCRFGGGVRSAAQYWRLLTEGRDAVGAFPEDRGWDLDALFDPDPDRPGTCYVREGGFLDGAAEFDPGFFGISPREARAMDPQQRVLLEVAWETVESAGLDPAALRESRTGVFMGTNGQDYGSLFDGQIGEESAEGYIGTGNAASVLSGRLSYVLGLEGPAVTVDTACSSSLVSLHLAAEALRRSECALALAGGVTVMSTPRVFTEFSRQRGLAANGRCKAFAEAADGTGWGEGVGVLLLERLSDARANGHEILAVIRGSAVNQDGASNGLTAPNGPAQQRVIRQALAQARLAPDAVDAVEAHGTGTVLGDPIEAKALLAAYGQRRDAERPLWLGSVKSNLGHTQAAAGVAGVIKMILALRHGTLPRTLHIDRPTPHVDWSAGTVRLLTESQPWPAHGGEPRRAGVSAFGVSGTNAHLILEQAPDSPEMAESGETGSHAPPVLPWILSAKTPEALTARAATLAAHITERPELSAVDVAHSLTLSPQLPYRAAVLGGSRAELLAALAEPPAARENGAAGRTAFLFSGQGSQRLGMGRELHGAFPVFAAVFDEVCGELDGHLGGSVRGVVFGDDAGLLARTVWAQAGLFAVEVALFRLLESWGVRPDYLLGHSIGEVAAACVAGVFSLPDAARLVAARGRLMDALPGGGAMVAVGASCEVVVGLLSGYEGRVEVAAVNGPASVVVSGEADAVARIADTAREAGHRTKQLEVSHAFHSPRMEPMLAELGAVVGELTLSEPRIPIVSNVTGALATPGELTRPSYWLRHVRRPVQFLDGVRTLATENVCRYVELGPDAVLTAAAQDCLPPVNDGIAQHPLFTAMLRRDQGEPDRAVGALAELYVHGVRPEWGALFTGRRVELPTYPFARERYWQETARSGDVTAAGLRGAEHPLLGALVTLAEEDRTLFTGRLSLRTHPWLADHAVRGSVFVPGTALVELAVRAGDETGCGVLEELTIEAPLVLPERGEVRIQLSVGGADADGGRELSLHSRRGEEPWTRHAAGRLAPGQAEPDTDPAGDLAEWPPPGAEEIPVDGLYEHLAATGFGYGPAFQGLRAVWRRGTEVFAEVRLPPAQEETAGRFGLHPALLDAALHALGPGEFVTDNRPSLPFSWTGVRLHASGASALRVRVSAAGTDAVALEAADPAGTPVASVTRLALRPVTGVEPVRRHDDALFRVDWTELPPPQRRSDEVAVVRSVTDLAALAARDEVPAAVHVPLSSTGDPSGVYQTVHGVLELLQAWNADERFAGSRLVCVTEGALAARPGEAVPDPETSAVWGLVRSAQAENPGAFQLVDMDAESAPLLDAVTHLDEPQLALRAGRLLAPRLARTAPVPTASSAAGRDEAGTAAPVAFDPRGTVLITGGTGGLGALLARHLVAKHGVRHVLLAGRRGTRAPGAAELAAAIRELGGTAHIENCDVSDREALARLLADIPADRPLTAVVHAAGVLDDGVIGSLTPERISTVLRPKLDAARHLHELTRRTELSAFVLFSSASGVFGAPGQGSYAAGNAALDALAQHRHALGLPAVSLAWGLWSEGMGARLGGRDLDRVTGSGLTTLDAEEGLALFDHALHLDEPLLLPAPLDLRPSAGPVPPLLRGLLRGPARRAAATGPRSAGTEWSEERLADVLRTRVAAVLGHGDGASLAMDSPFTDLGLDSLAAVELRNGLATETGLRLSATLIFDHPTPAALLAHLVGELVGDHADAPETAAAVRSADADDPVVIVGMACRYPGGVRSPEDLWELLTEGRDGIAAFPTDRGWDLDSLFDADPETAGGSYVREGGFLYDAAEFDAGFFGISPHEALAMDPQQRLLLETAWQTVERAGIDPTSLRGSGTGVFAGVMYHDYAGGLGEVPEGVDGYLSTGNAGSVLSGRIAYTLGLEGPAVTVDTACSSSLVTLHLAAQALRQGECSLALAGGATVMATPTTFVEFSLQRGLAADGRCKSFAASADGTGWGEGVGMVLLERLSDARRNGHRVLAVLRGSAVNQDGASNGLTAPNGPSQQRVIRQALAQAGIGADGVDAVEAHGTGTRLGDPIEAQALLATYGQQRPEGRPLWLGSVKSNIGHTQAAAGVGGVIKTVLALRHGVLPRTLHVDEPTPHVDWSSGGVALLTEEQPWPQTGRPRRAAVSAFGISGTNAHVVLEQAPSPLPAVDDETADTPADAPEAVPWLLSAPTRTALRAQAQALLSYAEARPELDPVSVGRSLALTRSSFAQRAAVTGTDRDALLTGLAALARGEDAENLVRQTARPDAPVVFVFPGQGAQWVGMALELAAVSSVFAGRLAECGRALELFVGWRLEDVLGDEVALGRVDVVQPVLWAVMVALAEVWRSVGVVPWAVVGHSQGEIAAAVVSGALSVVDGARVVVLRSRVLAGLSGLGGMVVLPLSVGEVGGLLGGGLELAAVNGPRSVVVSGGWGVLEEVCAGVEGARWVSVDYASHSSQVECVEGELVGLLGDVCPGVGGVPLWSTVTGGWVEGGELDGGYWYRNVRETVRFGEAVEELGGRGCVFVEVSPHPVLVPGVGFPGVGSLRRGEGGLGRFLVSVAEAHCLGVVVDWAGVLPEVAPTDLPTYAFQRERYWLRSVATAAGVGASGAEPVGHPLWDTAFPLAGTAAVVFNGRLSQRTHPWLAEHAVGGTPLLPGTAFLDLALTAGRHLDTPYVAELTVEAPLPLPSTGAVVIQAEAGPPEPSGVRRLTVYSRSVGSTDEPWTRHASGVLSPQTPAPAPERHEWPPRDAEPLELAGFYPALADTGLGYGPAFQRLSAAWRRGEEVFAEVRLEGARQEAGHFRVHPALLDSALHAIGLGAFFDDGAVRLPFSWNGVSLHTADASVLRVRIAAAGADAVALTAHDGTGAPVMTVDSLVLRPLAAGHLPASQDLFRVDWQAVRVTAGAGTEDRTPVCPVEVDGTSAVRDALDAALHGVREAIEAPSGPVTVFVTRGAQAATAGEAPDPAAAAVWGMVRSAQSEHPGRFQLVDLEPGDTDGITEESLAVLAGMGEPQLAVRSDDALAPRLVRVTTHGTDEPPWPREEFGPEGTVLITGGLGTLGRAVARRLVTAHGVRHLLLVGRSGAAPGTTADLSAELEELGAASVRTAVCDVADRAALAALLDTVPQQAPLRGVVHAAGVLDDGVVHTLTPERLTAVLRPKVDAARHLHELTRELNLTAFVLFSSASGLLGAPGQAAYAAANGYLDALAATRRAAGLPGLSLVWGLWAQRSGMTAGLDAEKTGAVALGGVRPLDTDEALALFDAALNQPDPLIVPLGLDLPALRARAREEELPPPLRQLVPTLRRGPEVTADTNTDPLALVRAHTAAVLGHASGDQVDPDRRFLELGFDSLTSVRLRNRLVTATGLQLTATAVFDHPTPARLAVHLAQRLDDERQPEGEQPEREQGLLAALYRQACQDGKVDEATGVLIAAARLRPVFTEGSDRPPLAPVRLTEGGRGPVLVALPSLTAMSSPDQYARVGSALRGRRSLSVVPLPGFLEGEELPANVSALTELAAASALAAAEGEPFVLLAYSSGGWAAQEVAAFLERRGSPARGLVLLDTYLPGEAADPAFRGGMVRAMFDRDREFGWSTDIRLTAMGGYFGIFHGWTPQPSTVPTLQVRAGQALAGDVKPEWPAPHDQREVPGDHFTMLEDGAVTTAGAVDDWLRDLDGTR